MNELSYYVMGLLVRRRPETFNRLSIISLFVEVGKRLGFFGGLLDALVPVDGSPIKSRWGACF